MGKTLKTRKSQTWKITGTSDTVDDPIADSLAILTKLYGRPVSRNGIRAGLPLENNRLSVPLIPRAAARAGLSARVLKRKLENISRLELPCILLRHGQKTCVVTDIDHHQQQLTVILPESGMGKTVAAFSELNPGYSGYAIFAHPTFNRFRDSSSPPREKSRHWFWGKMLSSWRIYRDVLVASFLINLFGLASPFFILNVYDRVIPNAAFETLWVLAIGIGIVYLFSLVMQGLRGYFVDLAGQRTSVTMSAELFEKTMGMKMVARPQSVGGFSNQIQQFDAIRDFITSLSITALVDLPFVGLGLAAIWYLSGPIVVIHLVAILILISYSVIIHRPLRQAIEKVHEATGHKNGILVEGIQGLENLKMLGAESEIQRNWEESIAKVARWGARSRMLSTSVNHLASFVMSTTVVAVVVSGVYAIANGQMSQGGLIAIVILTRQAVAPMAQVVNLAARFHRAHAAYMGLKKLMALPVERPADSSFLHRSEVHGRVEFREVSFRYPEQTSDALKEVSFSVDAGERIGIIGTIGSGKTTLGKLLMGLYEPQRGLITLDDTDIRQIDPTDLRHFIGCVPQDITLFRGTLKENIVLGQPEIDDETILRAASIAGVDDFVKNHAMGYDMQVGEQGRNLSGGQRQAVALARALLLDPKILVLDEPSSSMDARTENALCKHLAPILPGKTLILITHRASLLALVERIIVLDRGVIRADGPKDVILEAVRNGQLNV